MKFDEIFWGEVKIDELKGGRGCKQKGNDYTFVRCQIVRGIRGYYK